jgi:outer membrane protein assembly factor BamB
MVVREFQMHMKTTMPLLLALGATSLAAHADWAQYHGPTFNNQSDEKIAPAWPKSGPEVLWRARFNTGFSSLSVADGRAYTLVRRAVDTVDHEGIVAVDAATGKELWFAPLCVAKYRGGGDRGAPGNAGGDGPRSTPSVEGDRVYVYSSQMKLFCFDAASGRELWTADVLKDYQGSNITWESAASPVVDGGLVYVFGGGPGEALLAFDQMTGKPVWKCEDDGMTHSTPTPVTLHGIRQVIFFTQKGLVSVEAKSGRVLWRQDYPYKTSRAISPVVAGDLVYVSQGYGIGAGVYRIARTGEDWSVQEVWRTPNKQLNHWSTPVIHDGYIYGIFDHNKHATAPLKCVDLTTGLDVWEREGFGMGNVILVDGKLIVLTDYGEIVMVEPTPKAYTEIARAKVLDGKCWSTPTLSQGRLYIRSTTEGACLAVAK